MNEQLTEILTLAKKLNASDIHLRTGLPPVFRIAGKLSISSAPPIDTNAMQQIFETTVPLGIRRLFEKNLDVDYSVSLPGISRFRVNCFQQRNSLAFVFRQIPFVLPNINALSLEPRIIDALNSDSGLILICGPTGSGKTTTIAALLENLNQTRNLRIVTLEDPIEFLFRDAKSEFLQREYRRDFVSFPDALRATLRQDPDIIMVGEMRERETIELAMVAAETGHLVISTLHASTAASAIERIYGVFPAEGREFIRDQLASVLVAIIAQGLIPKKDDEHERVAVREVLLQSPAIANLIRTEKQDQIPLFLDNSRSEGMISMNYALELLVKKQLISPEMAFPYSPDPAALHSRFTRAGIICEKD
ncbi:MAG: PilT/PilU family type 4a pilus ATPase [Candidatus Riflebacteria bacterium]|nr:PilT/PilU family type 4a pilus ATPase [Candidatus Riflebacteria bacterium]